MRLRDRIHRWWNDRHDGITPMSDLRPDLTPATPEEFEAVCAAEGIGPPDGEG